MSEPSKGAQSVPGESLRAELPSGPSLNTEIEAFGHWRADLLDLVSALRRWIEEQGFLTPSVSDRLDRIDTQVRANKVMVAFVAEFSRGKSELINAIFFASYGRRIMPASAGRTTMCPTELGYDDQLPPCLLLLPIETRLEPQALMEWRMTPEKWIRIELDANDGEGLATAMAKVSEVRKVSLQDAPALGLWSTAEGGATAPVDADGLVEVPRWRHAVINMAHPLLKQGLVILDTPGLNAIGAEPELTVNLIPQAQAALFILSADAGVTKSDLDIWRNHLVVHEGDHNNRLAVLNKIDVLWDGLSTVQSVSAQIEQQRVSTAATLGVSVDQVIPVSAQKGLLAKVRGDSKLLAASRLGDLEQALVERLVHHRKEVITNALAASAQDFEKEIAHLVMTRKRDLSEQALELKGLKGKNSLVIKQLRGRIEQEEKEFDGARQRMLALRSIHNKSQSKLATILGSESLKKDFAAIRSVLTASRFKIGLRTAYEDLFDRLEAIQGEVADLQDEMTKMLHGTFRQLNSEFGFSLQIAEAVDLGKYRNEVQLVRTGYLKFISLGNSFGLMQENAAEKLLRALYSRIRSIHDSELSELEAWNRFAANGLDTQLREKRRNYARRIEAVERIGDAADGLGYRLDEIGVQERLLDELGTKAATLARTVHATAAEMTARH
jgi:hypothetical protein